MTRHRRCERWTESHRCGDLAQWETESGHWFCDEHVSNALRDDVDAQADTQRSPEVRL